ncbi:UDP-glucose 4-epimerase GalE [Paenirhodobacter sp. CAU 1674]|uniref:UDP-glucose 4-epimerase GalE n=1 Tax=Paenirhodobacter sp. CAU 1674 TaxID=3032596 RepID=UPI0023D98739|nr:UDP-glucose 4-epimerase GalE [Paenirhodobacter sp. CAU 1674]MDF2142831.1 UDP-glucose 4-epimerase GalE [Paenirhodobacter sp. CAU 1674]
MTAAPRILVTGGAGYIGAHCCKALARAGIEPVSFDNLSRGHRDAVKWGPLEVGDLRDRDAVLDALVRHRIEAVIHFAALAYVGESVTQPTLYYDNNLGGMVALLGAMAQAGVRQIVFSSSCATYGVPQVLPIDEATPQNPINPYGRTKLFCEWMLRDAAAVGDLRYVALRYFNAAGADPEGEIGEHHTPETHLIPLALMAAYGTGPALRVFGTDYPTPDGTCIRDYIHVDDLAQAHLRALTHLADGGDSLAVNLGTGQGASVRAVIAAVERVTGRKVPVTFEARRPGDPAELTADPRLAEARLGFRARHRDLDRIVADAAPWFAPQSEVACR